MIVTGGAGFIGCNFVRTVLRKTSWRVVVFDKLTYAGNRLNLRGFERDRRYAFVRGDISDRCAFQAVLNRWQPQAVVNFAAETHVDRSIDSPRNFLQTNVIGTFELLDVVRQYWFRADAGERRRFRFLHVSTDEVYGSLGQTGQFTEDTPYAPNSPYAASKASSDHFVRAYHQTYGLPTLLTNCSNNYGYYQFPEKLIPLLILSAIAGKRLPVYGDGLNVRDWLFVEDHCDGILAVLERGQVGERYNIGGNSERTNLEVLEEICAALDAMAPGSQNPALTAQGFTSYSELKTFVPDRPGHDRRYAIDCSRIRRRLDWNPQISLAKGIRLTVRWYLLNLAWCEAVQHGNYAGERLGIPATTQVI
jgi:dTDP-glucose 4,6-dehydratase